MTRPTLDELYQIHGSQGRTVQRYAATPGSGPAGKTCRDCQHVVNTGNSRPHYHCGKTPYTHGDATKIKLRTPACWLFTQFEPRVGIQHT